MLTRSSRQFVRLYLEATGTPYEDKALTEGQDCIKPYMSGEFEGSGAFRGLSLVSIRLSC